MYQNNSLSYLTGFLTTQKLFNAYIILISFIIKNDYRDLRKSYLIIQQFLKIH